MSNAATKRGRPAADPRDRSSARLVARVTPDELERAAAAAAAAGVDLSTFVRRAVAEALERAKGGR